MNGEDKEELGLALWEAAEEGDGQEVKTLLHSKANIHYRHQLHGQTPLQKASHAGRLEAVKIFLARKADPNMQSRFGWSALHYASNRGHQPVAELLLNSNAHINLQDIDGITPLRVASYNGQAAVVAVLLARNADPTIVGTDGNGARNVAVNQKHDAVVKILDDFQEKALGMENAARQRAEKEAAFAREEMEKLSLHQEELEKLKQSQAKPPNSSDAGKAVQDWTVEDAQAWISSLGPAFAKNGQLFAENGVDGENLLALDKEGLISLGVSAGHATIIIQKLKSRRLLPSHQVASPSSAAPPREGLYPEVYLAVRVDLSKLVINKNKKLGAGHFGVVYMGTIGERRVAVKILTGGNKKEEFEKEVSAWEKLSEHENVAQLLGVTEKDGSNCIVMNYYPGGTLKEELVDARERGLALTKRKTLSILLGIAKGLKHLHDYKIVHRDLAARNILFENSARDRAVITDFGLSREVGQQGKDYYMGGGGALPFAWLPPETITSHKSTVKADVWSFGVVVWEVITQGLTPLSNLNGGQITELALTRELRNTLLNALEKVEDGNPELVKVVEMCLIPDLALRPSIDQVADTLQALFSKVSKGK